VPANLDPESGARSRGFLEFTQTLAGVSVLLGASLFLAGWSYLYGYYSGFGLSPRDIDLPINIVPTYSIPVVTQTPFWATLLVLVLLLWVAGRVRWSARWAYHPAFFGALLFAACLATVKYASSTGRTNARRDASVTTSTLPYVTFEGWEAIPGAGCSLDDGNFRLLLRSNGRIFVVLPIDSPQPITSDVSLRVCSFSESQIRAVRIQVGLGKR
jgi:hypothetical protein